MASTVQGPFADDPRASQQMVVAIDPAVGDAALEEKEDLVRRRVRVTRFGVVGANEVGEAAVHGLLVCSDHTVCRMGAGEFAGGVDERAAAVGGLCYGLGRYAYGFFVPVFRVEFGLDAAIVGVIAAGSYASYCVAIILSTILVPRFGARPIAVAAGCLATGGLLTVAFAPNTLVLAVGVLIAGSSTGVSSPPLAEAVARTVRAKSRDRTQTVINAAAGAGVAIAGPVALLTQEHWQAAWITFAIACAAVTVYVAFTVPPPRGPRAAIVRGPRSSPSRFCLSGAVG